MAVRDDALDALFAEPLTSFVRARKALAKRLRAEGDREGARAVEALKKPSLPAWALNQLVRRERKGVMRVLSSLDRQRDLQLGALDGSLDPKALRAARDEEREATAALASAAEEILVDAGQAPSKGNVDRITKALRAVALHAASREELLRGRLAEDAPPGGFEAAAEQLDPALLLAALSAKPVRSSKPTEGGDRLFARSVRGTRGAMSSGGETRDRRRARDARDARERAEQRTRDRAIRIAEAEAKLARLRAERDERVTVVEAAVAHADALQVELDAARAEARKAKRKLADLDERIRQLEKRTK